MSITNLSADSVYTKSPFYGRHLFVANVSYLWFQFANFCKKSLPNVCVRAAALGQ